MFSVVSSVVISVLILVFERPLLNLLFGRVEDDVMAACVEYMRITAYSFPALAVYNAGAAMCRSVGRADVSMYISAIANAVNVVGNIIGCSFFMPGSRDCLSVADSAGYFRRCRHLVLLHASENSREIYTFRYIRVARLVATKKCSE